jgi:SSS family solute:Na+ symporter
MQILDWIILGSSLLFIVVYGAWKTKGSKDVKEYILGNNEAKWWTIGISVMATQASAITFLSTPGQAYHDGMGFVQFYFGLPMAMVFIALFFIPIYHKLNVYTAYEFLEKRFDLKTRSLAAILFLIQRGLAAGITIYAPAIILSSILEWNLNLLNVIIGVLVIVYTVSGGTKAVNVTQKQQMFIIMCGMFIAFYLLLSYLPSAVTFSNALQIAGVNEKMNLLDFSINPNSRYTFWSGITGGFFLALSYFGTDQSQVQRYLSGKSIRESQLGLVFNGFFKVPMQFFILLTGVMVFVFFQFMPVPLTFNPTSQKAVEQSIYKKEYQMLTLQLNEIHEEKRIITLNYAKQLNIDVDNPTLRKRMIALNEKEKNIKDKAKKIITTLNQEANDKDYVFIHFILHYLPTGLVGFLLAVILSAAMSSTASELNALSSTTVIDIYKRNLKTVKSDNHYVNASKFFTLGWGVIAILFACFGTLVENLIQLVNIIGSVFYGTILGIFLVAFFMKFIKGNAVFYGGIISQFIIFVIYYQCIHIYPSGKEILGYLWLNAIGAALTIGFASLIQLVQKNNS